MLRTLKTGLGAALGAGLVFQASLALTVTAPRGNPGRYAEGMIWTVLVMPVALVVSIIVCALLCGLAGRWAGAPIRGASGTALLMLAVQWSLPFLPLPTGLWPLKLLVGPAILTAGALSRWLPLGVGLCIGLGLQLAAALALLGWFSARRKLPKAL